MNNILIFGSSGAIGGALVAHYAHRFAGANIHAVSRSAQAVAFSNVTSHQLDFSDENAMCILAQSLAKNASFDAIIVAIGLLHDAHVQPEKSLSQLSFAQFEHVFTVNTFIPAMLVKHFSPLLNASDTSVFALLSARVGSISDNRLGGWYAYRAAKAALNMVIKTASIEMSRRNRHAIIIGLHPGTVDSALSEPFQTRVREGKLFTPEYCAQRLAAVIDDVTAIDSGNSLAWDGVQIPW